MLVIVAHHYVVNSGLSPLVYETVFEKGVMGGRETFLLLFGWGGKTAINCFVLITGYFMCTSQIRYSKFLKLLGEVIFYNIFCFAVFWLSGYQPFSLKGLVKAVFPFFNISTGFTSCFLLFYLFIPFLNKLLHTLKEREHLQLMALCLLMYTILPSFTKANVTFNYVTWFMILYLIAAYVRIYPKQTFDNTRLWGLLAVGSLLLSWGSVVGMTYVGGWLGYNSGSYFLVSDSNKILALVTGLCAFMFFKNLKLGYNKVINTISASTFGVLMIHANSDTMRQWLWRDTLQNTGMYTSPWLAPHALLSVLAVFCVCTALDMLRKSVIEHPIEQWLKKKQQRQQVIHN